MSTSLSRLLLLPVLAGAAGLAAATSWSTSAEANYRQMSCGQLWYERNAVYAQYGFCFKTDQAIRTFGRRCYAPYGNLPSRAQDRVDLIREWEGRKGCSG
jgi:YARHG domain